MALAREVNDRPLRFKDQVPCWWTPLARAKGQAPAPDAGTCLETTQ